ncbi:hypothetical protein SANA_08200 [Gottschalkiaceae bacterium SANA]|nr:hypothetical protein SANA_08200 [Gottschalkiaceae bacterium SANA]
MKKRIVCILLCLSMLLNMIPFSAFALDNQREELFNDVNQNDWFYDSILYAVENEFFSGIGPDTFAPEDPMTRAMYVTAIGHIAGVDDSYPVQEGFFSDVEINADYAPFVMWAADQEISQGVGNHVFGPDGLITREQMATFTVRFFDAYEISYPQSIDKAAPKDFDKIEDYAKAAVLKLWNCGLFVGDGEGFFNPKGSASRAEGATFSVRMNQIFESERVRMQETQETGVMRSYAEHFRIEYVSNGGSEIEPQILKKGSSLEMLPIPYKENEIFSGWYYDKNFEKRVYSNAILTEDITLYAKYGEVGPLTEAESPSFASALDQETNFSITVESLAPMTTEEVKKFVTIKNLNSPNQTDFLQVSVEGNAFDLSGIGGFEAGATYRITLENEILYFQGFGPSVRNYNFTIVKDDVMNLALSPDMIYIPFDQVGSLSQEGKRVQTLSTPLASVGGTNSSGLSDLTEGTFIYDEILEIGDTVTIYEGIRPDQRVLDDRRAGADGEIAYVTITATNGNTYTFVSAQAEDVLFTPDVLPLNRVEDTDGNPMDHSLTVNETAMEFSDDRYGPMQLDSQTRVDRGDYIAFYEGEFGPNTNVTGYGLISSISRENGYIVIEYTDATMDEILAAMDMYNTDSMSGDELLDQVDVAALEADIEQQAIDSGFADEAALYLSELALKTDSFTELSEDFQLTSYELMSEDGKLIKPEELQLLGSGNKVEVKLDKLQANISTHLQHFDASGVRLTLDVGVKIKISVNDDTEIVITVTGTFEEEVRIAINVDGGAVWKWWGIFPYIAEYEVTANTDLFNFTGIGINASIVTKEKKDNVWTDNKELQNISNELRKLLDKKDPLIGGGQGTVADGLADKYKAMIDTESDWVNLFEKDIFSKEIQIPPIYIIVVELGVKFAVSVDMNISLGCDFYYENAKRYSYTVEVFGKNVTSDVVDMVEEHYEFTFYVMGTMGLKAGIIAEIKVGLFSTKVASVGFSAEAGVYTRVWGYFYYQLEYTASKGRSSGYAGALYFELGIYLEIQFEAQAFAGTFSYNPTLYENEWPLWSAGEQNNVQDFDYEETDQLLLKKLIRSLTVPDDLFRMSYMDLKTGDVDDQVFDDATHFTIETTNDAFVYDPKTNKLIVTPDEGDPIEEGQLIITWAGAPLAFTSAPIRRSVDIYWDNLNNGYTIIFDTNGGSAVPMVLERFNAPIPELIQPVKKGYDFDGWYRDNAFKTAYEIPTTMPDEDVVVYAKWIPREDTVYRVEHYQQNLNNYLYTLVEADTQSLYGTTDSLVEPATMTYAGFHSPESQNLSILPDGSAVVKYYYSRDSFTASFDPGEPGGQVTVYKYKFGKTLVAPQFNAKGYEFASWNQAIPDTMPAEDLVFVAKWNPGKNSAYRVEHYIQNTKGKGTTLSEIEEKTGTTNQTLRIADFARVTEGLTFEKTTLDGKVTDRASVKGDGSLVVKVYYLRNEYQITYLVENGEDRESSNRYGKLIAEPIAPVKDGYTFSGWKANVEGTEAFVFGERMPAEDLIVYGRLIPNHGTRFSVEHYVQQTTGFDYDLVGTDQESGVTDESLDVTSLARDQEGKRFEKALVEGKVVENATIAGDGSLVIQLYYVRNEYVITHQISNGDDIEKTYRFEEGIALPLAPVKAGYVFTGWKGNESLTEPFQVERMPSENLMAYGKYVPNSDTPYRVEHYQENVSDGYTLVKADQFAGITDTLTQAEADSYRGFAEKAWNQVPISGDGSTLIRIDYDRNIYAVDLDPTGGTIHSGDLAEYTYGIGAPLPTDISRPGYIFDGWLEGTTQVAFISESETGSKQYTAAWLAETDTDYRVKHIREDLSGRYTIEETQSQYGTTDTETEAFANDYNGFTPGSVTQSLIRGDGKTVIEIRYQRNKYLLNWNLIEGTMRGYYTEGMVKFGQPITQPRVEKDGYTFSGWYAEASLANGIEIPETMPAEDLILFGTIMANSGVSYRIEHLLQNADDDGYTLIDTENLTGYTDEAVIATEEFYDDFIYDAGRSQESGTIDADGSLALKLYYNRESFTVDYAVDGESYGVQESYKHGQTVSYPRPPEKEGYFFDAWQLDGESFTGNMPTKNIVLTATWSAGEKSYTVRYYQERLTYTNEMDRWALMADESTVETGTFDSMIEVVPENEFVGFTTPDLQNVVLNSQLSTVDFHYRRNGYELMWNLNEGTASNDYTPSGIISFGTPIVAPLLVKTGESYTWDQTIIEAMPAEDLAYTAEWSANAYDVEFSQGGLDGIIVTYGQAYGILPLPEQTGYRFDGWFTSLGDDGQQIEAESVVTIPEDHILYAHWKAKSYTLAWELSGGRAEGDFTSGDVDFDTPLIAPVPTKTGYTFAGWDLGVAETMPAENLIYTAIWSAKSYVVAFNEPGAGSLGVTYGMVYGDLPVASKIGYRFDGWYTSKTDEGQKIVSNSLVSIPRDHILYAHWDVLVFNLTWNLAGGTAQGDYSQGDIDYGSPIIAPMPSKTGHVFAGWDTEPEASMPVENLTYTASWTALTYPVTLNPNGGHIQNGSIDVYTYGLGAMLPVDLVKEGHTFAGWYEGEDKIDLILQTDTGSKTYLAKWSANSYPITYYNMEEASNHSNNENTYVYEIGLVLGTPTRRGYDFTGWFQDEAGSIPISSISVTQMGPVDLYAGWVAKMFSVTLNTDGGTLSAGSEFSWYTYGIVAVLPTSDEISKMAYNFAGWFDGSGVVSEISSTTIGDQSYSATWLAANYDISYELNGGSNNGGNPTSYTIESADIHLGEPEKVGYTFAGWFADAGLKTPMGSPEIPSGSTGDHTLYAGWTANSYALVFNSNEGVGTMAAQSFTVDVEQALGANLFSRQGYDFVGWATSANGGKIYDNEASLINASLVDEGVVNLYALWSPIAYSISYELNGGTNGGNPTSYTVESQGIALKDPSREGGYVFSGWYDNPTFTGVKVTNIQAGTSGNLALYAQWKHYGVFTVSAGSGNTFTITRTGGFDENQRVYYRTQNGSAIGGTHFTHVDNSLVFGQGESVKTLTISENAVNTAYAGKVATSYSNVDRVYSLDLYKIEGGGVLGTQTRAVRSMTKDANYAVDSRMLNDYKEIASVSLGNWEVDEDEGGDWNTTRYVRLGSPVLNNKAYLANQQTYIRNTASAMKIRLINFRSRDNGDHMYRFVLFNNSTGNPSFNRNKEKTVPNVPSGTKAALVFGFASEVDDETTFSVNFPASAGYVSASGTSRSVKIFDIKWASGQDRSDYVLYGFDETCGISLTAYCSGIWNHEWIFKSGTLAALPKDMKEPSLLAVAPMANTTYNDGDKIVIALVFDEIVASASNVSIRTALSPAAFTLAGGLGTNVLYFEGTVSGYGGTAPTKANIIVDNLANIKDLCH